MGCSKMFAFLLQDDMCTHIYIYIYIYTQSYTIIYIINIHIQIHNILFTVYIWVLLCFAAHFISLVISDEWLGHGVGKHREGQLLNTPVGNPELTLW